MKESASKYIIHGKLMMNKNILITGAAGFIGSFLCDEFFAHQYNIVGIDNFFRGKRENLAHLINQDNFILKEYDISAVENIGDIKKIILENDINIVFHLAAINGTQYFYDRPLFVLDQNVKITQNLLTAIENTNVKYIIYTSSSEVYGNPLTIPTNEQHPILLNSTFDRDSYAASKAIGEFYIRLFSKEHNLSSLILRLFNMYGERMVGTRYGQVIPEFVNRMLFEDKFTIIGDGRNTRSFCYINDATKMMRQLMEKQITGLINLGNDHEVSILELAQIIHVLNNHAFNPIFLPERSNDHKRRRPDITHLQSILPELTFTKLENGLKKVIDFYKK